MPPAAEPVLSSAKEIEIPVPWGVVKGKLWGCEKRQPVLALHGWQDNANSFDGLAPLLLPEISLLCIDLPGHGFSSQLPKGMTYYLFWDTLVLIRRIVKYFKWEKVSIMGHSLGGAAGFLYAAVYPKNIDKLVCIDIACPRVGRHEVVAKQVASAIDKFLKYETLDDSTTQMESYETMMDTALNGYSGSVTLESCEILMKRGLQLVDKENEKYKFSRDPRLKVAGLAMFSKEDVLKYASEIKCEYLNIRADPGIQLEVPELYDECLEKIKKSAQRFEYHKVPGTHHLHLNDPMSISGFIAKFLLRKRADTGDFVNTNDQE